MIHSKKGFGLNDVPKLGILLVVTALLLGIGSQVLTTMKGTGTMTSIASATDGTNTFTAANGTAVDFTPSTYLRDGQGETWMVASSCTGVTIYNATSNYANVTSDFTVSGCSATLAVTPTKVANATTMQANFTYNYNVYNLNYNITRDGENATEDMSGWQTTWSTILAASIVLGLIAMYIMRSGQM